MARAVRAHPTRFGALAALPWQDPQAAVDELARAAGELGHVGALLHGRPGDTFLDDPRYLPVLAKLGELRMPLYLHPGLPLPQVQAPYYGGLDPEISVRLSTFGWGWHHEAGIHVVRMMLAGLFEKVPTLQVISGHWGEMVPFYLNRLDDMIPPGASLLSRTVSETYRMHVSVTPSGMLNQPALRLHPQGARGRPDPLLGRLPVPDPDRGPRLPGEPADRSARARDDRPWQRRGAVPPALSGTGGSVGSASHRPAPVRNRAARRAGQHGLGTSIRIEADRSVNHVLSMP